MCTPPHPEERRPDQISSCSDVVKSPMLRMKNFTSKATRQNKSKNICGNNKSKGWVPMMWHKLLLYRNMREEQHLNYDLFSALTMIHLWFSLFLHKYCVHRSVVFLTFLRKSKKSRGHTWKWEEQVFSDSECKVKGGTPTLPPPSLPLPASHVMSGCDRGF